MQSKLPKDSARIFFSTGEVSGDIFSARLAELIAEEAEKNNSHVSFEAIGGTQLKKIGAHIHVDTSAWSVVGKIQTLGVVLNAYSGWRKAKKALRTGTPGLFIPVDFGGLNIKLARYAKTLGWKVLYFIPPGSWRRENPGKDIPQVCDAAITQYSWYADLLKQIGTNVHFFGHPIKQRVKESLRPQKRLKNRIGILPGSRVHELNMNLPIIAEVCSQIDNYEFEICVSPNFDVKHVKQIWEDAFNKIGKPSKKAIYTSSDVYGVLSRAHAAIVCAGTATLEAGLCGCPSVVMYATSKLMNFEVFLRRPKYKFVSIASMILDRKVHPEFVMNEANAENIYNSLSHLLEDTQERKQQLEDSVELSKVLGPEDALTRSAKLAFEMVAEIKPSSRLDCSIS